MASAAVLAVAVMTAPADAGPPLAFGRGVAYRGACALSTASGTIGPDGRLRSFLNCGGSRVHYVFSDAAGVRGIATPWTGYVAASATDGRDTWVLMGVCDGRLVAGECDGKTSLRVAGRRANGTWIPPVVLSTTGGIGRHLAARAGGYWAMWSEGTGLHQVRTYAPALPPQRVVGVTRLDQLAVTNDRAEGVFTEGDLVFSAHAGADGVWHPELVAVAPVPGRPLEEQCEPEQCSPRNTSPPLIPHIAVDGPRTYVAYNHGYVPMLATRAASGQPWATERVPYPEKREPSAGAGWGIRVAAAAGRVWVAWDENQSSRLFHGTFLFVAQRDASGWTGVTVPGARSRYATVSVWAAGATSWGRLALLYLDEDVRRLRVQR